MNHKAISFGGSSTAKGTASTTAVHQAFQWILDPDGDPATDDAGVTPEPLLPEGVTEHRGGKIVWFEVAL